MVTGDLLDQSVEIIVNSWNRNIFPWWLLLPQGVSAAIKRRAGYAPFTAVWRAGVLPLGGAVLTTAGKLPQKAIIHVAGINLFWCATDYSIRQSVISAMGIVNQEKFKSVAFPLIGAGTGGCKEKRVMDLMQTTLLGIESNAAVFIVQYAKK
jgi:O-acetyl-ADP-ribose deacetylase (regulator of RNase III)